MKRRRKITLVTVLAVFSVLFLIGGIVWYAATNFNLRFYENRTYGFGVGYPSDWVFQENVNGAVVIFYSPLENQLDFFRDNINIVVQDISSQPMSLEEYSKVAVDQMKLVFGDNMRIQELSDTMIDGLPAKKFIFTGQGPQAELKYMSIWMIDHNTVYQLTYLAIASQYPNHLFKIHAMLQSFRRMPKENPS